VGVRRASGKRDKRHGREERLLPPSNAFHQAETASEKKESDLFDRCGFLTPNKKSGNRKKKKKRGRFVMIGHHRQRGKVGGGAGGTEH